MGEGDSDEIVITQYSYQLKREGRLLAALLLNTFHTLGLAGIDDMLVCDLQSDETCAVA
jgi:hypothetical protein